MEPPAHANRARTRAKASSPGTIAVFPACTSSRRAWASRSQAACEGERGSKLAIRRSTSLARSSAGRLRACAARSSTGVGMAASGRACVSMPQRGRGASGEGGLTTSVGVITPSHAEVRTRTPAGRAAGCAVHCRPSRPRRCRVGPEIHVDPGGNRRALSTAAGRRAGRSDIPRRSLRETCRRPGRPVRRGGSSRGPPRCR